jgi:hypothetical protein
MPTVIEEILIAESDLRLKVDEVQPWLVEVGGSQAVFATDEFSGFAFRAFALFDRWPDLLSDSGRALAPIDCFYNKYYWFQRFTGLWSRQHGRDAGMEQQAFQMLETVGHEIDWSIVELLGTRAQKDNEL